MAAEEILKLFDQNWFFSKHQDLSSLLPQSSNQELAGIQESEDREFKIPQDEEAFGASNVLVGRSVSDQNLMSSATSLFNSLEDLFSPTSVLNVKPKMGKLQTILSGKEVREFLLGNESTKPERVSDAAEETTKEKKKKMKKKKKKHEVVVRARRRKSMSDLEFQEVKGFIDLGFVFSEEDGKDSDLVSILPGLQRLGRKNRVDQTEENRGGRNRVEWPYMSEAWGYSGGQTKGMRSSAAAAAAAKWKFPAPENEVDMKDHLRLWAHTVASTVR